jgi:2-polyprenyl-3-methyl-5-hydroxy-6-metoxy-1,4-benzoquinol methylase
LFHVERLIMQTSALTTSLKCLVCDGSNFQNYLELQDYFLSKEMFKLTKCLECGLLYTMPQPHIKSLARYYDSEEYTSHNTSKWSLKNLIYLQARRFALSLKLRMIERYFKKGRILDIGGGTGEFLNHCRKRGWDVIGIEPSSIARENAFVTHGLEFLESVEILETEEESMDVITMWHVLEHMEDPAKQFQINYRLLKPGGLLVVALPNYESWEADYYGKFWAAYDVPRHLFHFSQKSLTQLSEKSGFRIEEIRPLKLDAYYISLLSEKYAHGKMSYFKAFLNGWRSNTAAKKGKFGYSSWVYLLRKK